MRSKNEIRLSIFLLFFPLLVSSWAFHSLSSLNLVEFLFRGLLQMLLAEKDHDDDVGLSNAWVCFELGCSGQIILLVIRCLVHLLSFSLLSPHCTLEKKNESILIFVSVRDLDYSFGFHCFLY